MTKEELEIAKAACCVATMWDQYEGTEHFDKMVGLRVQHLIKLVRNYQQSFLPSNMDEAAEEYAPDFSNDFTSKAAVKAMRDAFKAGAEWMAGQGVSKKGEVFDNNEFIKFPDGTFIDLNPSQSLIPAFNLNNGDEVVVQIRKK